MYAIDFEFDGKRLSDFGCILSSFDGRKDGVFPSGADIVFSYGKSLSSDTFSLFSSTYNDPYSVTLQICKNPCLIENEDNPGFTPYEVSAIQKWLCRRTKYCKFKILSEGYEDIYWNGVFTSQQYMSGNVIIGLELVFTADAPYGYLEDISTGFSGTANAEWIINSVSDEEGYIIPDLIITIKTVGTFELTNSRDNRIMQIDNCNANEVITISGKQLLISSSDETHDLGVDFNYVFPRLFNKYDDNKNIFTPSLACDIILTYTPAIKVGF